MKCSKVLALIAVVSFTLSTAVFAESGQKKHKAPPASIHGSVKSVSDSELVLSQKGKDVTLVMNSATRKVGDIKPGSNVTVQYRFENGKDVASMVKASGGTKKPGKGN